MKLLKFSGRKALVFLLVVMMTGVGGCNRQTERDKSYDVVIYGATSAGIAAAVQVRRMGKTVLLLAPGRHIGGLTTGGLGQTDIGNKFVIGGISREFYENIAMKYKKAEAWQWQSREEYEATGRRKETDGKTMWTFEPKVAMEVIEDFIKEHEIPVIYGARLDLEKGVRMKQGKIESIADESGRKYFGKVFIDATYEGDLMALSGVSYTVGREAEEKYGESLNGVRAKQAKYHQFPDEVDPYVVPGDPSDGLLPGVNAAIEPEGTGDNKVQAYCFRMCLTNVPENRIPFKKPEGYDEKEYEMLFRAIEAGYEGPFFIMSPMPNGKTDSNNKGPVSSDYIGRNYRYPDGDYKKRAEIIHAHEVYQKGLVWTLANHPRIPEKIRETFSQWGLPKDEFTENGHWTPQLYIREARRMISNFVMTQHHCTGDSSVSESIGMGAYTMDSHHVQRYVNAQGFLKNEGDVEVGGFGPYPISYRAIVPKRDQCKNLLVPVCLSATHIAFGSIRMEPVFMVLGQSAATAACLAVNEELDVQDVKYDELRTRLLDDKQILEWKRGDK